MQQITRKTANRLLRLLRWGVLIESYTQYVMMQSNNELMKQGGTDYIESEKLFYAMGPLFPNMKLNSTSFTATVESLCDNSIEDYKHMEAFIEQGVQIGMDKESIRMVCKQAYYDLDYAGLRLMGTTYFGTYINGLIKYLMGDISKKQLLDHILVRFSWWDITQPPQPANLMYFYTMMTKLEKLYYSIFCKRELRKFNKLTEISI